MRKQKPLQDIKVYAKKEGVYKELEGDVMRYIVQETLGELVGARLSMETPKNERIEPGTEIRIDLLKNGKVTKRSFFVVGSK